MAWWHSCQILGWISPWQIYEHGNPIQWFPRCTDLTFWTSNYGAQAGCHLWLPDQTELKIKFLTAWDIQQVDKSMFNRIGQDSTTTGTSYEQVNYKTSNSTILMPMSALNTKQQGNASLSVFFNYLYTITLWSSSLNRAFLQSFNWHTN